MLIAQSVMAETALNEFLSLHNQERDALEVPELEWSDELQASAQQLVNNAVFLDVLERSDSGYGQNSWSGEHNSLTFEEIFALWSTGKAYFLADKPVPQNCSADWEQCESYSQIVWSETTHIGCAAATSAEKDYIVCHYSPAGNIQDQTAY